MKFFVCLVLVSALVASAYTSEVSVESKSDDILNQWKKIVLENYENVRTQVEKQASVSLQLVKNYLKDPENKTEVILSDILKKTMSYMDGVFKDVLKDLTPKVEKYIELSKDKAQELREQLLSYTEDARKIAEQARAQAEKTWEELQEKAKMLREKVPDSWNEFQEQVKKLSEETKKQVEELKRRSEELKVKASEALEGVQGKVLEMTKEQLDVAKEQLKIAKEHLKTAKEQAEILRQRVTEKFEVLMNEAQGHVEKVRGKFEENMENVKSKALELKKKVDEYVDNIKVRVQKEQDRVLEHWVKAVEKASELRRQAMEHLETVKAQAKELQADANMEARMQQMRELAEKNLLVAQEHLGKLRSKLDESLEDYNEYWVQIQKYANDVQMKTKEAYGKLDVKSLTDLKEKALGYWEQIVNWAKGDKIEAIAASQIMGARPDIIGKSLLKKHLAKLRQRVDLN